MHPRPDIGFRRPFSRVAFEHRHGFHVAGLRNISGGDVLRSDARNLVLPSLPFMPTAPVADHTVMKGMLGDFDVSYKWPDQIR